MCGLLTEGAVQTRCVGWRRRRVSLRARYAAAGAWRCRVDGWMVQTSGLVCSLDGAREQRGLRSFTAVSSTTIRCIAFPFSFSVRALSCSISLIGSGRCSQHPRPTDALTRRVLKQRDARGACVLLTLLLSLADGSAPHTVYSHVACVVYDTSEPEYHVMTTRDAICGGSSPPALADVGLALAQQLPPAPVPPRASGTRRPYNVLTQETVWIIAYSYYHNLS